MGHRRKRVASNRVVPVWSLPSFNTRSKAALNLAQRYAARLLPMGLKRCTCYLHPSPGLAVIDPSIAVVIFYSFPLLA